jgi:hypothetical protein
MDIDTIQTGFEIFTSFVGTAALIASVSPNPVHNAVGLALNKVLNICAANVGKAQNKD